MTLPTLLVSWLLPLLLGSGLYALAVGWPWRNSDRVVAAGLGWIAGAVMCGVLTRLFASADPTHALMRAGPWASAIAALAWSVAWWRRTPRVAGGLTDNVGRGWRPWALITLVLLGWRGWLIASDILLHPTLAWDAWAAWEAKAKIWILGGQIAPFVSFGEWLAHPTQPLRTGIGYSYPDLLPWTIVWFAGPVGWIEPWINLAWFGLWIAMLLAQYGQLRALGVDRSRAWIGTYVLGSLPLLESHVALGGYADLWLAALFGQGAFAWLRWRCGDERRQLGVVLAIMLLLPMIKLEGSVWSIVLGSACVFSAIPRWTRRRRLLLGIGFASGLILLSMAFSAAWIGVARRYIGNRAVFDVSDVAASLSAFGQGLWAQENWNLLWFCLPVVLLGNRRVWMQSPTTRRLAVFVGVSFLLIAGLFVCTAAARYAQSYSAVNRLLLQLAPMVGALLILASRASPASDRLPVR